MLQRSLFFTLLLSIVSTIVYGQLPPTRKPSAQAQLKALERAEFGALRKQIAALKEFELEKRKALKVQQEKKQLVKVLATIDSIDVEDSTIKTITGYITQQIGDASANVYEILYNRTTKTITSVKKTGEGEEPEVPKKKAAAATTAKKDDAAKKKTKDADGDEEEDEDEEKEDKPEKTEKPEKDE